MDILVSVGASEYGFDRLLKIIDELCDEHVLDGNNIIAQLGSAQYKPRNYKYFKLIGRDEYETYMDNADLIISHAGTGSVIPPLKLGKKVIVFQYKHSGNDDKKHINNRHRNSQNLYPPEFFKTIRQS